MAYPSIQIAITDGGDANATEQDILFGPAGANPPTSVILQNEPLSTTSATASSVEPGTYYAQRVVRNAATGETASTTPVEVVVLGPSVSFTSHADGDTLVDGDSVTLAVDVVANAHAGAGLPQGIDAILFQYSTDSGTSWTTIGTAVCDDVTTPSASLSWAVVGGTTNLRATCIDTAAAEIGTEASIAVAVSVPVSDFTEDHLWALQDDLGAGITAGSFADGTGSMALSVASGSLDSTATELSFLQPDAELSGAVAIQATATEVAFDLEFRFPSAKPAGINGASFIELGTRLVVGWRVTFEGSDSLRVLVGGVELLVAISSEQLAGTWYRVRGIYTSATEEIQIFASTEGGALGAVAGSPFSMAGAGVVDFNQNVVLGPASVDTQMRNVRLGYTA